MIFCDYPVKENAPAACFAVGAYVVLWFSLHFSSYFQQCPGALPDVFIAKQACGLVKD